MAVPDAVVDDQDAAVTVPDAPVENPETVVNNADASETWPEKVVPRFRRRTQALPEMLPEASLSVPVS